MTRKASATLTRPWQGCASPFVRFLALHGEAQRAPALEPGDEPQAVVAAQRAPGLRRQADGERAPRALVQQERGAAGLLGAPAQGQAAGALGRPRAGQLQADAAAVEAAVAQARLGDRDARADV